MHDNVAISTVRYPRGDVTKRDVNGSPDRKRRTVGDRIPVSRRRREPSLRHRSGGQTGVRCPRGEQRPSPATRPVASRPYSLGSAPRTDRVPIPAASRQSCRGRPPSADPRDRRRPARGSRARRPNGRPRLRAGRRWPAPGGSRGSRRLTRPRPPDRRSRR